MDSSQTGVQTELIQIHGQPEEGVDGVAVVVVVAMITILLHHTNLGLLGNHMVPNEQLRHKAAGPRDFGQEQD
jgi:hypothetical protein